MKNGGEASAVDPVTLSVLWNGLISIADDMGTTLRHTAYSAAVREGDDFSTGIFDARGRLVAQGNFSPGHLGSMPYVVRHVLDHFAPADFEPGDCILLNDSFMGSGHYPDCFMTSPLFAGGRLAGFAVNIAHHADMGGAVPGSQIVEVREAFQEGLRILPVRIARGGEIREDVLRLILGNVRLPEIVRGDLLAQRNANAVASERYAGLVAKYGFGLVEAAIESILDRSEARMRELIEALPDGAFSHEDFMDDDARAGEPLRFHVEITVDGDSIVLDWSGSSDQVEAGINSYINYTRAYSGFAVKVFTDPHLPQNEGVNRPVEVRAAPRIVLQPGVPRPRAAAVRSTRSGCSRWCAGRSRRCDRSPRWRASRTGATRWWAGWTTGPGRGNRPFVFYDVIYGGYGGRSTKDRRGSGSARSSTRPTSRWRCMNPKPRSGSGASSSFRTRGAGAGSGAAAGCARTSSCSRAAPPCRSPATGTAHAPPGLAGGMPGTRGETVLNPGREEERLASKETRDLVRGDVLCYRLSGAGGYGPPEERDEEAESAATSRTATSPRARPARSTDSTPEATTEATTEATSGRRHDVPEPLSPKRSSSSSIRGPSPGTSTNASPRAPPPPPRRGHGSTACSTFATVRGRRRPSTSFRPRARDQTRKRVPARRSSSSSTAATGARWTRTTTASSPTSSSRRER